jgi:sigma-B regulation protein RsbQ
MNRVQAHSAMLHGSSGPMVVLAHGIGGNQSHWPALVEHFAPSARLMTFSLAGSAGADPALFSPTRHSSLFGFADDLAMLCAEMDIQGAVYVGHSLSAVAGMLASISNPGLFSRLVLINASARYIDDPATGYVGGFTAEQIQGMLHDLTANYTTWAAGFGATVMANPDRPHLVREFVESLISCGPEVAAVSLRAAFEGDYRKYVSKIVVPTLVVQSASDPAVSPLASHWLGDHIPGAQRAELRSTGHFPHVAAPEELIQAIEAFGLV